MASRTIFLTLLFAPCALAAAPPASLRVACSSGFLPGVPVLVRVEALAADGSRDRDLWDGEATFTSDGAGVTLTPDRVTLRNGQGSALVAIGGASLPDTLAISASLESLGASRTLQNLSTSPVATASGTLADAVTEWSGVVRVTGSVTVPTGKTLRILPGALVMVDGALTGEGEPGECVSAAATPSKCGLNLVVQGTIDCQGTEAEPITITASDPRKAWGEIHHNGAAASVYRHAFITRSGNSPKGGHTDTGPSFRVTNAKITFEDVVIGDTAGKIMQSSGGDITFRDSLLTRTKSGPEISSSALLFERNWVIDTRGPDDNDGIYLHAQQAGQLITLADSVFAGGDDDGVDTLDSKVTATNCIIRNWANPNEDAKGVSVYSGEVSLSRCLVTDSKEGIAAKGNGSGATVNLDRCTIARCPIALHAYDKFQMPNLKILYFVTSSIIDGTQAVVTDDYPPTDTKISYSSISSPWPGTGNITGDPLFADLAGSDFHLQSASPCIDAGDPAAATDPDGTRADMGCYYRESTGGAPRFRRANVNGDGEIDLSDTIRILFYLFVPGTTIPCLEAADVNDDGQVLIADAIAILEFLFRNGATPLAPFAACGEDPTPDTVGCDASSC